MTIKESLGEGEAIMLLIRKLMSLAAAGAESKTQEDAIETALHLVGGLLGDINRIANALETLAIQEADKVPEDADDWLFNNQLQPDYAFVDLKLNNDTFVYRCRPISCNWINSGNGSDIRHWRPSY